MNHQGLRWNVHCVANVALRIRLNLYKRGFKIYDLLVFVLKKSRRRSTAQTELLLLILFIIPRPEWSVQLFSALCVGTDYETTAA